MNFPQPMCSFVIIEFCPQVNISFSSLVSFHTLDAIVSDEQYTEGSSPVMVTCGGYRSQCVGCSVFLQPSESGRRSAHNSHLRDGVIARLNFFLALFSWNPSVRKAGGRSLGHVTQTANSNDYNYR
jgi:hypothetical protein